MKRISPEGCEEQGANIHRLTQIAHENNPCNLRTGKKRKDMWKRYRRAVALAQAVVIITLPFVKIGGESALRFDIPGLRLFFFGTVIWIREFYLFLLALLFLIILVTAVTTVMGRIWCGWLCPQTVLLDLSADAARLFPPGRRSTVQKLVLLPLSAIVSLTLIWYFVPPHETMDRLFSSRIITGFFIVQWLAIYLELAFLGRKFCTTICPYSMLQSGLFDEHTLVIAFDGSRRDTCMGCDKCARVCPVGIDIKDGIRRECIACAECIDACRTMTAMAGVPPFIGYRGRIRRTKTAVLAGLTTATAAVLFTMILLRPDIDFVVSRDAVQPAAGVNSYTYSVQNNTGRPFDLRLGVRGQYDLIGESSIRLSPYSLIHGRVMVRGRGNGGRVVFILDGNDIRMEREVGYL